MTFVSNNQSQSLNILGCIYPHNEHKQEMEYRLWPNVLDQTLINYGAV